MSWAGPEPEVCRIHPGGRMSVRYYLLVLDGDRSGQRVELQEPRFTIGRRDGNHLVLPDTRVSGVHAEIVPEGGTWVLRDLGSTNGTLLDGRRIDEVPLSHGDIFAVGAIRLRFVDAEGGPLAEKSEEVQVARVDEALLRRAGQRRSLVPLLLLFLVVAAGGAWLLFLRGNGVGPGRLLPPLVVTGNLLAADVAALEEKGFAGWVTDLGSLAFNLEASQPHSGETAATAWLDGGGAAILALREPVALPAGAGRATASIFLRLAPGTARAALHLVFFTRESRREAWRVPSPWVEASGGGFQPVAVTAAIPPGCDAAGLEVVVVGDRGQVAADDAALKTGPGTGEELLRAGGQGVLAAAGGVAALLQGGKAQLLRLQPLLTAGEERPRTRDLELLRRCLGALRQESGAELHPPGTSPLTVGLEAGKEGDDAFRLAWILGGPAGKGRLQVTLALAPGVEAQELPAPGGEGIVGLRLRQGGDLCQVSWVGAAPLTRLTGADELTILILPLPAGPWRIQTGFAREQAEAIRLVREAAEARSRGRSGEAMAKLRRLLEEVPFHEPSVAEGRKAFAELLAEGEAALGQLSAQATQAEVLDSVPELEQVAAAAADLEARYRGVESITSQSALILGRARSLLAELAEQLRLRDLERLQAVKTALGDQAPALRKLVEDYIGRHLQAPPGAEGTQTGPASQPAPGGGSSR